MRKILPLTLVIVLVLGMFTSIYAADANTLLGHSVYAIYPDNLSNLKLKKGEEKIINFKISNRYEGLRYVAIFEEGSTKKIDYTINPEGLIDIGDFEVVDYKLTVKANVTGNFILNIKGEVRDEDGLNSIEADLFTVSGTVEEDAKDKSKKSKSSKETKAVSPQTGDAPYGYAYVGTLALLLAVLCIIRQRQNENASKKE